MNIGIFLDVDHTLTEGFIQRIYAEALGCVKEYEPVETEFQKTQESGTFGDNISKLFANRGFSRGQARETYRKVKLRDFARQFLSLGNKDDKNPEASKIHVYLVSSGPNYYIDSLAEEYGIPAERVYCSIYKFDKNDKIESCETPINPNQKRTFVENRVKKYDITIGVGDDHQLDNFVHSCTIPLLISDRMLVSDKETGKTKDANRDDAYISSFSPVKQLIEQLTAIPTEKMTAIPTEKNRNANYAYKTIVISRAVTLFVLFSLLVALGLYYYERIGKFLGSNSPVATLTGLVVIPICILVFVDRLLLKGIFFKFLRDYLGSYQKQTTASSVVKISE